MNFQVGTVPVSIGKAPVGAAPRFKAIKRGNIDRIPQWNSLPSEVQEAIMVVSAVLPFRTNQYVVDELIDWRNVPDDPMFQLTFSQRGMLDDSDYARMARLWHRQAGADEIEAEARRIRDHLNPHPAGQLTHNVPTLDCAPVSGVQHKYRETALFFPNRGQTCHAYCGYCFRWAQFVGDKDIRFAAPETRQLIDYLEVHPEVTDILITGGDPLIMKTRVLRRFIEPLMGVEQLVNIRIGTKAVAYWPQRFVNDDDAHDLLALFQEVSASGKQLALMAHYSHPVELSTTVARDAVRKIRNAGGNVRMQSPVVRHVNDDSSAWAELWRTGVALGCVPYYMFVQRDTGARDYFELPLLECWEIFRQAYNQVSGLARTVRGPSMSTLNGKVHLLGPAEVGGSKALALEYLQARDPSWVRRPFFAQFDAGATWFDQLLPLGATDAPFFEPQQPASPDPLDLLISVTPNGNHDRSSTTPAEVH